MRGAAATSAAAAALFVAGMGPAAHAAAAAVCEPPQHGVILGMDHNIGMASNVSTVAECCAVCGATDGCAAYNLHTDPSTQRYQQCFLHSTANGTASSSDSVAGKVTGSSSCQTHHGGFWGSGFDIGTVRTSTAAGCCAACRGNPKCASFAFHSDGTQACWLHSSVEGFTASGSVVGGVPHGDLPALPPTPGQYVEGYACRDPDASSKFKFCDPSLSLDARLDDLVPRITNDEAGPQLTARQSPNISRIGLPSYYWGTNAIHGVQNVDCLANGTVCPTSFPAPNAMSAAWNLTHVHTMGRIIGQELRAYYNLKVHNSLDTWSPTINIDRDPRWGRNVESPGEDPLLNGLFGAAYTEGLQALQDEEKEGELLSVVTMKHWLAYSIEDYNNVTRTNVDVNVTAYDLADTYMVPWKIAVQEGGALGVMCSYNMVNGRPTCANPALNKTLRDTWGFQGYVTSDSDSCACIFDPHNFEPTIELAARDCLAGGTDIDSGATYSAHLASALANASVLPSRDTTDLALRNTYRMRMRLGLFAPNHTSSYRAFGLADVGAAASRAASLDAARQAMTLLKNDGGALPFKAGAGRVAVVGQAVNDTCRFLTGNYDGPMNTSQVLSIFHEVSRLNGEELTFGAQHPDPADTAAAIQAGGAQSVVLVVDNSEDGGGEGHDRYTISLSDDQAQLVKAVAALGLPTVLVVASGGAISLDGLADVVPAIIQAWMPGVQGGTAIAETVFGLNNPGGKLPITIYESSYVNATDFLNMDIAEGDGRTYRYYHGSTPIMWPFGFGLSYTTFNLTWANSSTSDVAAASLTPNADSTMYTVTVTNTGPVAGDEVVQAFFHPSAALRAARAAAATPTPIKQLFDFQRVHLAPGESKTLHFQLNASALALADADGHRAVRSDENEGYAIAFSRGHGRELVASLRVAGDWPRLETFQRWW